MSPGSRTAGPTVAIVGNPNTGKTTLFNALTGSRQMVGNWPGVTVEKREGELRLTPVADFLAAPFVSQPAPSVAVVDGFGERVHVVDLPGIYALSATSEDEIVARDYVLSGEPDLVVNIVDAANIERNFYLTLQLIEMKVPVLVILNMADLAERAGIRFSTEHLAGHLDCPVVAISSVKAQGIRAAKDAIAEALRERKVSSLAVSYPQPVEQRLAAWAPRLAGVAAAMGANERWVGLKLVEGDGWVTDRVLGAGALEAPEVAQALEELTRALEEEPDVVLADSRYGLIHGLSRHVVRRKLDRITATDRIDRFVMNRFLGVPVFLAVMYAVFWVTVSVGGAFVEFFDVLAGLLFVDSFGSLLCGVGAPGWLTALAANGVGAGVQTVATFVPVIFLMFVMLSLLEDSGYMARAAFVMDRLMRWIGLPGKSFVPMIVGFGCTVPAIMGTRTLESRKDRTMTIFMAPFMSCGARLPVYALFSSAFFPRAAGVVVFSLYVVGIVLAILTGLLLKHTLLRGEVSHFVMELPPYHAPRPWGILRHAGTRVRLFVVRAGVTITSVVAVLSMLNSFGTDGTMGNEDRAGSVLATLGRSITPVFRPMGVEDRNWPATVGLFTGVFAKEVVVGTLASLYSQNDAAAPAARRSVRDAVAALHSGLAGLVPSRAEPEPAGGGRGGEAETAVYARMRESFSAAGAYAYLLFVLIYFPCVSALGAAVREMGAGYAWLLAGYLTVLAWSVATLFYQVASGPRPLLLAMPLLLVAAMGGGFALLGRGTRRA